MRMEIDGKELMRLLGMGATLGEMAKCFGCTGQTVGRRLRKLGIDTGPTGIRTSKWKGGERMDSEGYAQIMQPDHPRADMRGYVRRSILMWEAYHGKPFPEGKMPHHLDGDRLNDDPRNIAPLTRSEHSSLTARGQPQNRKGFAKRAE